VQSSGLGIAREGKITMGKAMLFGGGGQPPFEGECGHFYMDEKRNLTKKGFSRKGDSGFRMRGTTGKHWNLCSGNNNKKKGNTLDNEYIIIEQGMYN